MLRAIVVGCAVLAGTVLPVGTAWAGGIVDVLAPAFRNGCTNHYQRATARAAATTAPGTAGGNALGIPVTTPFNHCGGADASNGADQIYGAARTELTSLQGAFNAPCTALPAKVDAQSVLALVNLGVQDVPVLGNLQNQQCTGGAGAGQPEPLSHLLDQIPVLSSNGHTTG
ncbi:hypothetical protein GCM10027168_10920 [Streptomyces capparidis]